MIKVLYLEDDANMRSHTTKFLKEDGYIVEDFQRIDQVKEYYNEHFEEIDCIVTDLNMADEWLDEYQNESDGCMLSGWVWIQHFVLNITPNMPTIIYSGYVSYLKEYLTKRQESGLLNKGRIYLVSKGGEDYEELKKVLDRISESIN